MFVYCYLFNFFLNKFNILVLSIWGRPAVSDCNYKVLTRIGWKNSSHAKSEQKQGMLASRLLLCSIEWIPHSHQQIHQQYIPGRCRFVHGDGLETSFCQSMAWLTTNLVFLNLCTYNTVSLVYNTTGIINVAYGKEQSMSIDCLNRNKRPYRPKQKYSWLAQISIITSGEDTSKSRCELIIH